MTSPVEIASSWIAAFLPRVSSFFQHECGCEVISRPPINTQTAKEPLLDVTAMVSVGEPLDMTVAFSFENAMISHLMRFYADVETDDEQEAALYSGETAADILNNIIGNTTADFQDSNKLITFTPPIVVTEGRDLIRRKATIIVTQDVVTDQGVMKIMCMAPSEIFEGLFREKGAIG